MEMIFRSFKPIMLLWGVVGLMIGFTGKKAIGLANPASQNCTDKGGTLQRAKRGDGGVYGICIFSDNRQCEEWALFRSECPVGGLQITGYLTREGIYCALRGGMVLKNETVCQLPSGKRCSTEDLYNGTCS
jgi:putative hemolysin